MNVKVHVLVTCKTCLGKAYLPVGEATSSSGEKYIQHQPCNKCEGSGMQESWISLDLLADLITDLDHDPMMPDYLELASAEPTSQYIDSRDAAGI